ncbi:MAG: WD40/YVTN/BNR-like repeat-containing protein [Putridiphycobacter sp.]
MSSKFKLTFFFCWLAFSSISQDFYLENQWTTIGPYSTPGYTQKLSSLGLGPIEFVKATPLKKGLLLAGAINGGLFYSADGGESWVNAGSDEWAYSSASWGDFYPENANVWFAASCTSDKNNAPGSMGEDGGIYRSKNQGSIWEKIASPHQMMFTNWVRVNGVKFDPNNPKKMWVLTSEGLAYTNDCMAEKVEWKREYGVKGEVYDLEFVKGKVYMSVKKDNSWKFMEMGKNVEPEHESFRILAGGIDHLTMEVFGDNSLLVLIDYKRGADKLFEYKVATDEFILLNRSQRVVFGHGHTFAVNPHNQNEVYIGSGTRLRRWNYATQKFEELGYDYHVDVEWVSFDPFDSNLVYMGNHGGVSISSDKGASWSHKSDGLGIAEVLGLAVSETDPNQVVIGTYHDGTMVYADWQKDGQYTWKNVNGGDALIPLIDPNNNGVVYTSNQYGGGGLYISTDTGKINHNIHKLNDFATSGWEMAATLHPTYSNVLFFNFKHRKGKESGNIDIARTVNALEENSAEIISDFKGTHGLTKYKVYGLFNSKYHPNILVAYVLHYNRDEKGKTITEHKLFRNFNVLDSAHLVKSSWQEIEMPNNIWLGDLTLDSKKVNKMYMSFSGGVKPNPETPDESGMIFYMKYGKTTPGTLRNHDISLNIPSGVGGRYNLVFYEYSKRKRYAIITTRSGAYLGTKFNLKGGGSWKKIGYGLPHCKIYGAHYHEKTQVLTVGLKGRGVWKISLKKEINE